jgi:aryl-phospho-beta-D-glucosidase BglC (GH1 family)
VQTNANTSFADHCDSWSVEEEFDNMTSYGLNTVRIPVGYWMREDIVYEDSEHFPQGALSYLEQGCGWASDHGFYIIIDLHGAPGAQVAQNSDTGQVSILSLQVPILIVLIYNSHP